MCRKVGKYLCCLEETKQFLVKFNPEFSSELLEEAKACNFSVSLVFLAAKKMAIIVYDCVVSVGQLSFDCDRMQGQNLLSQFPRKIWSLF